MECQFCHGGFELEKVCGKLHSVVNDTCNCVAHHRCMQYSSNLQQFKFPHFGGFYIEHVETEVKRGQKLTCCICKRKGASAGCSLKYCKRTYHYPCARKTNDVRTCRLVKYTSQDVDTVSTEVVYCTFCSSSHQNTFTEKLRLAPEDELSSNTEDDVEDGATEELSKRTTDGDLFQQLFPSSSSPDDNADLQSELINQVDSLTCIVGNASLPMAMDSNKDSVGTSSTTVNRDALGNISTLDAAVSATSPSLAHHPDQTLVDSSSRSDCRRDRLCLKSSQRKRNARQMMDRENDVEPQSNNRELLLDDDYFNWRSSSKRARIDSSSSEETLRGTETEGIKTSAETLRLNNGCFGEGGFNNSFLPDLSIPDPMEMDGQIHLKQPRNLTNICASSSRTKRRRMSHPDQSQQVITSFLTPAKKLDVTDTRNCASEVPNATKDRPKAQKQLQLCSGTFSKFNENRTQTKLISEAENIPDDLHPIPSSILPQTETNASLTESMDISPITDVTVSPIKEFAPAAKEAFVSSVSPGFSGCLERFSKQSKKSPIMSGIFEPAFRSKTLEQNVPSTIKKLELDGRGNFSLLTEIDSLPLSDSSDDATLDGSESGDIDCNDMDLNSRSTVSSLSYEELSSTFALRQMDDNTDIDQVFGLCIPVVEDSVLDNRTSKALMTYAICSLNLVEENIFLWQITGLNENQIISIILQFSRHSRDKNELELLKMLFEPKSCDADSLLDNEMSFAKENVDAVWQEIEQNFSEAEKKYGRCVGKLCNFDDLRISAAFLILSNANDVTRASRSSLPKSHRVHVCSEDTKFVISHSLCDAQKTIISDNEYENLRWWLETFDYSTVLYYPMENVLHSSHTPSVTNRLRNFFMRRTVPGGDTSFVFIHRTDPDLLIYRSFIRKLLAFVKEELVTCNRDACIVFDVGQDLRIERLADVVMPCLIGDQVTGYCFEVEAFSGTNPTFSPVSCLVVHLLLKFP